MFSSRPGAYFEKEITFICYQNDIVFDVWSANEISTIEFQYQIRILTNYSFTNNVYEQTWGCHFVKLEIHSFPTRACPENLAPHQNMRAHIFHCSHLSKFRVSWGRLWGVWWPEVSIFEFLMFFYVFWHQRHRFLLNERRVFYQNKFLS